MKTSTTTPQLDPISPALEASVIEVCAEELWDGVYCVLPPGHVGSHVSDASTGGCSLTWSGARSTPVDEHGDTARLDSFLRMMRAGTVR